MKGFAGLWFQRNTVQQGREDVVADSKGVVTRTDWTGSRGLERLKARTHLTQFLR